MKKKLLIIPWLLYSGFIFVLSSYELDRLPKLTIFGWDKVIHMVEFAIYSFLAAIAVEVIRDRNYILNTIFTAFIITALFGAGDEIHQYFVAGRSASIFDFIADLLGGIIGLIFFQKSKISDKLSHADTR